MKTYKDKVVRLDLTVALKLEKKLLRDDMSFNSFIKELVNTYLNNEIQVKGDQIVLTPKEKIKIEDQKFDDKTEQLILNLLEEKLPIMIEKLQVKKPDNNYYEEIEVLIQNNISKKKSQEQIILFLKTLRDLFNLNTNKKDISNRVNEKMMENDYTKVNCSKFIYSRKKAGYYTLDELKEILEEIKIDDLIVS